MDGSGLEKRWRRVVGNSVLPGNILDPEEMNDRNARFSHAKDDSPFGVFGNGNVFQEASGKPVRLESIAKRCLRTADVDVRREFPPFKPLVV